MPSINNIRFTSKEFQPHSAFWKNQLNLVKEDYHFGQKNEMGSEFRVKKSTIDPDAISVIKTIVNDSDTGIFTCLVSSLAILLHKYSHVGRQVIIDVPPFALHADKKYSNKRLPLVFFFEKNEQLRGYLNRVQNQIKDCYRYQDFPLDLIGRHLCISNIFVEYDKIHASFGEGISSHDLVFSFQRDVDQIRMVLRYNVSKFDDFLIEGIQRHFLNVLNAFHNLSLELSQVQIMSSEEKSDLLEKFNDTSVPFPFEQTIPDIFAEQVNKYSSNIAVVFDNYTLSYEELDELSSKLAFYLRRICGICSNDVVAIYLDRSHYSIIAMLGILKAGATFLPIDIYQPASRVAYILSDSGAKVVLTNIDWMFRVNGFVGHIFAMDIQLDQLETANSEVEFVADPEDICYIIYTSGSTGVPKGVRVTHRSLNNYLYWFTSKYQITSADSTLICSSIAFDLCYTALWSAILAGGRINILEEAKYLNADDLISRLIKSRTTFVKLTPSHFSLLINDLSFESHVRDYNLRLVVLGGEEVKINDIDKFFKVRPEIEFVNHYGPTETTIGTLAQTITFKNWESFKSNPVIGGPVYNNKIFVLNNEKELLPLGMAGEIHVSGEGLSAGYANQPELTNLQFFLNPFNPLERIYATGDIGQWTPEGKIKFLGRKDFQLKIKGFRVELGEVEAALLSTGKVREVVVVDAEDANKDKYLLAFYRPVGEVKKEEVRLSLEELVPHYMIPLAFQEVDTIPLTANGKIDRKALLKVSVKGIDNKKVVAPKSEAEILLINVWQEVLGVEELSTDDNFFQVGGDSLKAVQIVSRIYKESGKKLDLKFLFSHPTVQELGLILKENDKMPYSTIEAVDEQPDYPVSNAQRRLWVLHQLDKQSIAYNVPGAFTFSGHIDKAALVKALSTIIQRHETLRTTFFTRNGEVRQKIHSFGGDFELQLYDLRDYQDQHLRAGRLALELAHTSFDLEKGPLFKVKLLEMEADSYWFLFNMHHIISDARSKEILIEEMLLLYKAFSGGHFAKLPPLQIQYKDYSVWQQKYIQGNEFERDRQYWLQKFSKEIPILELPTDFVRPAIKSYKGELKVLNLREETTFDLKEISKKNDVSLFLTLVSTIHVLLYKYTGQCDIVIGTPVTGRDHLLLENQIGIFLNNLPLRTTFGDDASFSSLLHQVKEDFLSAIDHQYPFDKLVEDLGISLDLSRSPIFDVVVLFQSNELPINQNKEGNGLFSNMNPVDTTFRSSIVDIRFVFKEISEGLQLMIEYNTDLFKEDRIQRMLLHYAELVENIIRNENTRLSELQYLNEEEKKALVNFNGCQKKFPLKALHDLFEERIFSHADNIAFQDNQIILTYSDLNRQSNKLAHHLRDNFHVIPEMRIGLMSERSEYLLIGLLGILKSGGCYVPIDPSYPVDRKEYLLKDAGVEVLLTLSDMIFDVSNYEGKLFAMDVELEMLESSEENPEPLSGYENLAYMIYTSGSTGHPKGVMIEHKGVVNMILSQIDTFQISKEDRVLQFASSSFDASISEVFIALLSGATLVMLPEGYQKDASLFSSYIVSMGVTVATLPPSFVRVLPRESLKGLRVLITAGEAANVSDAVALSRQLDYYNAYGPTECSVCVSLRKVKEEDQDYGQIPIGTPIWNTEVYLLDQWGSMVGIGVDGELCVSGVGLARGYHRRQELNKIYFIDNPFKTGTRLYRTGDICRWTEDGLLLYKGRKDGQLKVRGHRIEAGEVEAVLKGYSGVEEAVVDQRADVTGEKILVGYLISAEEIDGAAVKRYMQSIVPGYMIPDYIVKVDRIPVNTQGKVDRRKLPGYEEIIKVELQHRAAETETEKALAGIWEEVLGRASVGIEDNFFEIGGQSLKAVQILSRIYKELNKSVELRTLFNHPTIYLLARHLDQLTTSVYEEIQPVAEQPHYPLSYAQKRIWIANQYEALSMSYNIPGAYHFKGTINPGALRKAFIYLLERHEILRTSFVIIDNAPRQLIRESKTLDFPFVFLDLQCENNKEAKIVKERDEDLNNRFDLERDVLMRAKLFQLEKEEYILLFTLHHIIADGWSAELLLKEIIELYKKFENNEMPSLQPLKVHYKDYVFWEDVQIRENKKFQEYWMNRFTTVPEIELPVDFYQSRNIGMEAEVTNFILEEDIYSAIQRYTEDKNVTLYVYLLATINSLLFNLTGQTDIVIGTPATTRDHLDFENQIGNYLNTLPIRTTFEYTVTFEALLAIVNSNVTEAFANKIYPYDLLIDELRSLSILKKAGLFNIGFTWNELGLKSESPLDGDLVGLNSEIAKAKSDLWFHLAHIRGRISVRLVFRTQLFKRETIQMWIEKYKILLRETSLNPAIPLGSIDTRLSAEYEIEERKVNIELDL